MKNKQLENIIIIFNALFSTPIISSITGFGMFFYFVLLKWNVFIAIFVGLYTASVVSRYCLK